jgi:hypothetical protein
MPARSTFAYAALLTASLAAQGPWVTFADAGVSGAWTLRELDESQPTQTPRIVLQELEWQPIEMTNRTRLSDARADRPRRVVGAQGPRLELPGGARVWRYRLRGGERWGFLLVTANGRAKVLLERAGIGATGRDDPFTDRIGVAPDGRHAAIATLGGELAVARLDGGDFPSTGTPARLLAMPAAPGPLSLTPGATQLFVTTVNDRVLRCGLADAGQPIDVTPIVSNARMKDEFALSGDGRSAVFLYGPRDLWTIWLLRESGPPVALPPQPSKYEEPGYLPENPEGPRMLLSDDGRRLLYTDSIVRDEIYLLDVAASTPVHVTSDVNFQPYIGVGILPAVAQSNLLIAVGNPGAMDWYLANTSSPLVFNVTKTNGNATPPFGAGGLSPASAHPLRTGQWLVSEKLAAGYQLRGIDPTNGAHQIVHDALASEPELGVAAGTAPGLTLHAPVGDSLWSTADGSVLLAAPPGIALSREASAFGVGMLRASAGAQAALVFRLPGPQLVVVPEASLAQASITSAAGLTVDSTTLRYFAPGIGITLSSQARRLILSGLDA